MKVGRNARCPCGSGEKFKRCHGRLGNHYTAAPFDLLGVRDAMEARERVRRDQQGLGRPIISANIAGHKVVAVGNRLHSMPVEITFPDFLGGYLREKLGIDWARAEAAKPADERHPLVQWFDQLSRLQRIVLEDGAKKRGHVEIVGVAAGYFTVAYGLYLLDHNAELQDRLLVRLRDPGNFQGAYYELIVARVFIEAGFELALENETDGRLRHCEFAATSRATGKRYWVEAKMRGVAGELGRTAADGTSSSDPLSGLVRQLNAALAKPAPGERMIFLDLNAPMPPLAGGTDRPIFLDAARDRLLRYEREELPAGEKAYVFVTSAGFHKTPEAQARLAAMPLGLGMPDFNRPGFYGLAEWYLNDRRHADALRVARSFDRLLSFPSTFDGSLPAVSIYGEQAPVVIGETYRLQGAAPDGGDLVGKVTSAMVVEEERKVVIGVSTSEGSFLASEPISEHLLSDYRSHPEAFFGKVAQPPRRVETPQELFEFLMESFGGMSRDDLLEKVGRGVEGAAEMDDDELRARYVEGLVHASGMFEVVDGVMTVQPAARRPDV